MDGLGLRASSLRAASVAPALPSVDTARALPPTLSFAPDRFELSREVVSFGTPTGGIAAADSDTFVTGRTEDLPPAANNNTSAAFMQDNGSGRVNDPDRNALTVNDLLHSSTGQLTINQERERQRLEALRKQAELLEDDEEPANDDGDDVGLELAAANHTRHAAAPAAAAGALWFNRHRFNPLMTALRAAYRKIFRRGATVAEMAALRAGEGKLAGGLARRTAARLVEKEAIGKAGRFTARMGARAVVGATLGSTVIGSLLGFGAANSWNPVGWGTLAVAGLLLSVEFGVRYYAQTGERSLRRAGSDMATAWGDNIKNIGLGLVEAVKHPSSILSGFGDIWSDIKNSPVTGTLDFLTGGYYSTGVATWKLWQWGNTHPEHMGAIKKLTTDVWSDSELAMKVVTAGAAGALSAQANQDGRAGLQTALETARDQGGVATVRSNGAVTQDLKDLYRLSVSGEGGWQASTGSLPSNAGAHIDANATLQQPRPTAGRKLVHPGYDGLAAVSPLGAPHAPSPNSNGTPDPQRLQNDA